MATLILENANIELMNGSIARGPVSVSGDEFLFRNTGSELDLYFKLKRDNSGGWYFAGGPGIEIPAAYIEQVGFQIDQVIAKTQA